MAAPTFVQEAETVWDTVDDKTTASFNVLAGDILVAYALGETNGSAPFAINGGSLTWTLQQSIATADYCPVYVWTATVDSNKSMTVTVTDNHTTYYYGVNVLTFRGSSGVGTSDKANSTTGDPAVTLTGVLANSAIVMANGDWNAVDGSTREYNEAQAGSFTAQSYAYVSGRYGAAPLRPGKDGQSGGFRRHPGCDHASVDGIWSW